MATQTPNLDLIKPEGTDFVRIGAFNANSDRIDAAIGDPGQLDTSEKTNLVLAINEAMRRGGESAPYIDEDSFHWMVWDVGTAQYVDTGIPAVGPSGPVPITQGAEPPPEVDFLWVDTSSTPYVLKGFNANTHTWESMVVGGEGPPGPQGPPGVVFGAEGQYAFAIEDGHLWLVYEDEDTVPDFHIDENGHLIMEMGDIP